MQTYQLRHGGSPRVLEGLTEAQIMDGLRDGRWEGLDEVRATGHSAWQSLENHPQFAELVQELEELDHTRHEEPTNLDMTPLIDVCLVLLIFFILTTTYIMAVQKVVPIPEPKPDTPDKFKAIKPIDPAVVKQRMVSVVVSLDSAKKPVVTIEGITRDVIDVKGNIDKARLADELRREVRGDVIRSEMLLSASGISWGTFIAIQDAARSAGIEKIRHKVSATDLGKKTR